MTPVVVRRSAVKMWLLAILAVPFVLYGADVLLQQRFVGRVLELIHPNGEIPGIETRDIIWAWVFVLVGGAIAIWALKELTVPRKLLEADESALTVRLAGPFSSAAVVPWPEIESVVAARASDDGEVFPVLVVAFRREADTGRLPASPWGARWIDSQRLAIAARDWDVPVGRVAEALDVLVQRARSVAVDVGAPDAAGSESAGEPSDTSFADPPGSGIDEAGLEAGARPAASGDHWAPLNLPDHSDAEPARKLSPELPPSRFAGSHWIILDEGD